MSQQEQDNKKPEEKKPESSDNKEDEKKDTPINPLDAEEIKLIKRYGQGPYSGKM